MGRFGMFRVLGLISILTGWLAACAVHPAARDLTFYVNHGILNIAELEIAALDRYAAVVGSNYTNDERVYQALKNWTVPLYGRYLAGLRRIRPQDPEVQGLHLLYIQGAEKIYEGFREKMFGLERKDPVVILSANAKIENGHADVEKWRAAIYDLMKKHNLLPRDA